MDSMLHTFFDYVSGDCFTYFQKERINETLGKRVLYSSIDVS